MGAAFITRRGAVASKRLEHVAGSNNGQQAIWKNLAVSTNTYFLLAESHYSDSGEISGWFEAIIEDGKLEVMRGGTSDFRISITEANISVENPYSNTYLSSNYTNLYRFC